MLLRVLLALQFSAFAAALEGGMGVYCLVLLNIIVVRFVFILLICMVFGREEYLSPDLILFLFGLGMDSVALLLDKCYKTFVVLEGLRPIQSIELMPYI